jgi:hypothetical protein
MRRGAANRSLSARLRGWLAAAGTLALLGCGGGSGPGTFETTVLTPGSVDLTVDVDALARSLIVVDRTFSASDCSVIEGSITQTGLRRLLLFETRAVNLGELDVVVGNPASPVAPLLASDFQYHDCHGHYHMEGWASYELFQDGIPVALGTKQGFCLLDSGQAHPLGQQTTAYHCAFQGLSSGYADIYARSLDGQWVDVTGVPGGDYVLRVTINATNRVFEADDVHPNTVEVPLTLPAPGTPVTPFDDDHGDTIPDATALAFPIGLICAVEQTGDLDVFRVNVQAGTVYEFAVELQGLADSALRVLAGTGATLASNNDAAPGDPSSRILFTAPLTGPVYLEVRGVLGAVGGYRIVADLAP